jgi:DNA-binding MarR family transcriptional regulator
MDQNVIEAATLVGIVAQLFQTRTGRLLADADLTYSHFTMLNHLARQPDQTQSIGELADAVEINQPGVTKAVKRLATMELVTTAADPDDSRRRLVTLTRAGGDALEQAFLQLGPEISSWFEDWEADELTSYVELTRRLAWHLDATRI